MDFGRAIGFVFKDSEWVKKVLIGGLIFIIPLIGAFVVYGYALEVARRAYQNDDTLPEWNDFGGYLTHGFIAWVGAFIWAIPIGLIAACAFVPGIALSGDDGGAGGLLFFFGYCLAIPLLLVYQVTVFPILMARYAVLRNFGALFQFSEIIDEVRRAGSNLLMMLLIVIVAGFISQAGIIACFIGVFFTAFYSYLIMGNAAGQLYRLARGEAAPTTPAF